MDDTALLALGILMEEASAEILGQSGDLAFLESSRTDSGPSRPMYWTGERWKESVLQRRRLKPRRKKASDKKQRSNADEDHDDDLESAED